MFASGYFTRACRFLTAATPTGWTPVKSPWRADHSTPCDRAIPSHLSVYSTVNKHIKTFSCQLSKKQGRSNRLVSRFDLPRKSPRKVLETSGVQAARVWKGCLPWKSLVPPEAKQSASRLRIKKTKPTGSYQKAKRYQNQN
jgi:hypothetical protein